MKIAVFSDIHGNKYALDAIIKSAKKENVDRIICLGDIVGIGPNPKECLDIIINNNIEMVLGNHELYFMKGTHINEINDGEKSHHKWIKDNLNEKYYNYLITRPLSIEIGNMSFSHYLIKNKDNIYPFYHFDIIENGEMMKLLKQTSFKFTFIGHYHEPFEMEHNSKFIIDVGSSGCVKDNITSYILIENSEYSKKYIEYDRESFIKEIKENNYPERDVLKTIFFGIE